MSGRWRTGCVALALLASARLVQAEEAAPVAPAEPASPAPAAAADPLGIPVHGYLKAEYRGRWTGDASDHDLVGTLSLDLGEAERQRVTAHFLGDVSLDLDGDVGNTGFYDFDSLRDSRGKDAVPLVYAAYLDVHRTGPLELIRLGRQSIQETPEPAFFDGLRLETAELGRQRVRLGAYGGVAVRLYEGQSTDELLGGAYAQSRLWQGARLRLDWLHLRDDSGPEELSNDLLGADAWQSLGESIDLHAHGSAIDGEARDVRVRASYNRSDWDLLVQAIWFQLLREQEDAVLEADAFYPVLGMQVPYADGRLLVSKGFGDSLNLDLGVDVRRLTGGDMPSDFNREYERWYGTLDLMDQVVQGSSLSLTGEWWRSDGTETASGGLDVTCPVGAASKVSLGTAHYLYKYDPASGDERVDVQTYYLEIEHKPTAAWRLSAEYQLEDDSSSELFHEVRCEAIWSF